MDNPGHVTGDSGTSTQSDASGDTLRVRAVGPAASQHSQPTASADDQDADQDVEMEDQSEDSDDDSNSDSDSDGGECDSDKKDNEDKNEDDGDEADTTGSSIAGLSLRVDLHNILSKELAFRGKYAFCETLPAAPNPGLHIKDIGFINLPLTSKDAQVMKAHAVHAPYGHNEQTVVNTEVRDTWEIDAARVTFDNPDWAEFVGGKGLEGICARLGVVDCTPTCKLHKLLLYEEGSHFLPHQDTAKLPGMFATLIVVLPSRYTGGQVHVSHGSLKDVFDCEINSAYRTSVLVWYTDVIHEVKPITSGYRLALSYNLAYPTETLQNSTCSRSLPDVDPALARLKEVFHKWSTRQYKEKRLFMAYILKHRYSRKDLNAGLLKGEDDYLINQLRGMMEETKILACLANFECHISGIDDEQYEERTDYKLTHIVGLDGRRYTGDSTIFIDLEDLVPKTNFAKQTADQVEHIGYTGNEYASSEEFYRRTVMIFLPIENEVEFFAREERMLYGLNMIERSSDVPTPKEMQMFDLLASQLSNDHGTYFDKTLADVALRWGDAPLWLSVIMRGGSRRKWYQFGEDRFLDGAKKFGFERVAIVFDEMIAEYTSLDSRMEVIDRLRVVATEAAMERWCENETLHTLQNLPSATKQDIPILLSAVQTRGPKFSIEVLYPQFAKFRFPFDFWVKFIELVHTCRNPIVPAQISGGASSIGEKLPVDDGTDMAAKSTEYKKAIEGCLDVAMQQWCDVESLSRWVGGMRTTSEEPKIRRIVKLIDLCFLTDRTDLCGRLFSLVLKEDRKNQFSSVADKMDELLIPLIPELQQVLASKNIDMCSSPFGDFLRDWIFLYVRDAMRTQSSPWPKFRKVGCGCEDCESLNSFILSSDQTTTFTGWVEDRIAHVDEHLNAALDLMTVRKDLRRQLASVRVDLCLKKKNDVIRAVEWLERRRIVMLLIQQIGDDESISRLLGERRADLTAVFEFDGLDPRVLAQKDAENTVIV